MKTRDLRNHGGDILLRVARGETLTVTSNGRAVARLTPVPALPPSGEQLTRRWAALPPMSLHTLRRDMDDIMDSAL